ncbi:octopamine receptor beta-3R-like [Stylophora pistillata]|uniref:octopamine receptor beta-3R-like n=1 Tax=Stylophora pistillata TaxID=50429 RepID=UPI000C047ACD|nr:octopamine receptor beta-3R-like [Stylophora pistillata]
MNDLRIGNTTSPPNVYAGDSLMEKSFKCLAYGVVVALSVIGNTLIIFAFKLNIGGKLHTVNNMFIVSMAAGDLLLTVASTPERITRILADERWLIHGNWGIFLCKTTNYMEKLCMNLSVIHLTLIAIDRFVAVCYPRRKIITAKRAQFIIATAWFSSAVYCVPLFYYANLLVKNGTVFCKTRHFFINWRVWYLFFLSLLVLTLLVAVGLYAAIIIRLWRGERRPTTRMSFRSLTNARINARVLKMVAMIVFTFYCCILPYWIGWVFCSYYRNDIICSDTYVFVAVFLMYSNSAFNPAIYSFFNPNFRLSFRFILNKLCKCCFTNRSLYIQPEPKPKPIYDIRRGLRDCDEADKTKVECISIQNLQ